MDNNISYNNNKINIYILCGQLVKFNKSFFDLYKNEQVFKETIDLIDLKLKKDHLGYSIWEKIQESNIEDCKLLNDQVYGNIIIFMTQVSLFNFYESKGIKPDYIFALSLGEIAGAHISGMITLDMALYILSKRSVLLNETLFDNYFISIHSNKDYIEELKKDFQNIEISSRTSNLQVLISGITSEEYKKLSEKLKIDNINHTVLFERSCFHHSSLEKIKDKILDLKIESSLPKYNHISTYNGKLFSNSMKYNSEYLYTQMRGLVDINGSIKSLFNEIQIKQNNPIPTNLVFIEVSPISYLLENIQEVIETEVLPLYNDNNYFNVDNIEYYKPFQKNQNMQDSLNNSILNIKKSLNL